MNNEKDKNFMLKFGFWKLTNHYNYLKSDSIYNCEVEYEDGRKIICYNTGLKTFTKNENNYKVKKLNKKKELKYLEERLKYIKDKLT